MIVTQNFLNVAVLSLCSVTMSQPGECRHLTDKIKIHSSIVLDLTLLITLTNNSNLLPAPPLWMWLGLNCGIIEIKMNFIACVSFFFHHCEPLRKCKNPLMYIWKNSGEKWWSWRFYINLLKAQHSTFVHRMPKALHHQHSTIYNLNTRLRHLCRKSRVVSKSTASITGTGA